MPVTTVLLDLNGTLLPMDQAAFTADYRRLLQQRLEKNGLPAERILGVLQQQPESPAEGGLTLYDCILRRVDQALGGKAAAFPEALRDFYREDFPRLQAHCSRDPDVRVFIDRLRAHSVRRVLAGQPSLPREAILQQLQWAGLRESDFSCIASLENCCRSKPDPLFFRELLEQAGLRPVDCVMIGNDAQGDLSARALGIPVFLLTRNLRCPDRRLLEGIPYGDFDAMYRWFYAHV